MNRTNRGAETAESTDVLLFSAKKSQFYTFSAEDSCGSFVPWWNVYV
jgi:hypothetical protein